MKNIILRIEPQELNIRNRFSEEKARSELEAMERDSSYYVSLSRSAIQSRSPRVPKTGKRCRQSGCDRIF